MSASALATRRASMAGAQSSQVHEQVAWGEGDEPTTGPHLAMELEKGTFRRFG